MYVVRQKNEEDSFKLLTDGRWDAWRISSALPRGEKLGLRVVALLTGPGKVPYKIVNEKKLRSIQENLDPPCPALDSFLGRLSTEQALKINPNVPASQVPVETMPIPTAVEPVTRQAPEVVVVGPSVTLVSQ